MVQYSALLLMLSQLTGLPAGAYYHTISDAHVYEDQVPAMQALLERPSAILPTVRLTDEGESVQDIHDFRGEHFVLEDYAPQPAMRDIPVAP
jgi:thymidylate synthase